MAVIEDALAAPQHEQNPRSPLHNAVMKLDRYTSLLATVVVVLVIIGLSALAIKVRGARKAEWYNYANVHGCERVATKKGDIHVTPHFLPLNNSSVTMLSTGCGRGRSRLALSRWLGSSEPLAMNRTIHEVFNGIPPVPSLLVSAAALGMS